MQYFCVLAGKRKEYRMQGSSDVTTRPCKYDKLPIVSGEPCAVWLFQVPGHGHLAHVMLAQPCYMPDTLPLLPGRTLVYTGPGRAAYDVFITYAALLTED